MPEKDFIQWLDCGRIYAWRDIRAGRMVGFRVVLLVEIGGSVHNVTRYDTAHGFAHRDVLGMRQGLRGKLPYASVTYEQAFKYALHDIQKNAPLYIADYLAH